MGRTGHSPCPPCTPRTTLGSHLPGVDDCGSLCLVDIGHSTVAGCTDTLRPSHWRRSTRSARAETPGLFCHFVVEVEHLSELACRCYRINMHLFRAFGACEYHWCYLTMHQSATSRQARCCQLLRRGGLQHAHSRSRQRGNHGNNETVLLSRFFHRPSATSSNNRGT
jgi:hypothetical protein